MPSRRALSAAEIDDQIAVVDDGSSDGTAAVVAGITASDPRVRCIHSPYSMNGFGLAVRAGLEQFTGDAVAIVMSDGSDDPNDLSCTTSPWLWDTTARSARASCAAVRCTTTRVSNSPSTAW